MELHTYQVPQNLVHSQEIALEVMPQLLADKTFHIDDRMFFREQLNNRLYRHSRHFFLAIARMKQMIVIVFQGNLLTRLSVNVVQKTCNSFSLVQIHNDKTLLALQEKIMEKVFFHILLISTL